MNQRRHQTKTIAKNNHFTDLLGLSNGDKQDEVLRGSDKYDFVGMLAER